MWRVRARMAGEESLGVIRQVGTDTGVVPRCAGLFSQCGWADGGRAGLMGNLVRE